MGVIFAFAFQPSRENQLEGREGVGPLSMAAVITGHSIAALSSLSFVSFEGKTSRAREPFNFNFICLFYPHWKTCLLILKRGGGRDREEEKHQHKRETLMGCLSYAPRLWTEPGIFQFMGQRSNQLSHIGQGKRAFLKQCTGDDKLGKNQNTGPHAST